MKVKDKLTCRHQPWDQEFQVLLDLAHLVNLATQWDPKSERQESLEDNL